MPVGAVPQTYSQVPVNSNYNPYAGSMMEIADQRRPDTLSLSDEFKATDPQYSQGFQKLRGDALSKGPTSWLSMSQFQDALRRADAKEKGMLENASQTARAKDMLAAGGGLSSGARERVEEQGLKNYMSMAQDQERQGNLSNLSMNVTDEANKMGQLDKLTQVEGQKQKEWLGAKKGDYDAQMDVYKTQMEALAAERQANATASAGKK